MPVFHPLFTRRLPVRFSSLAAVNPRQNTALVNVLILFFMLLSFFSNTSGMFCCISAKTMRKCKEKDEIFPAFPRLRLRTLLHSPLKNYFEFKNGCDSRSYHHRRRRSLDFSLPICSLKALEAAFWNLRCFWFFVLVLVILFDIYFFLFNKLAQIVSLVTLKIGTCIILLKY